MTSALALQCSTNWAMKTHTLGTGQFVEWIHRMKMIWNAEIQIQMKIWSSSGKYIIIIILCVEGRKGQVLYIVYIGSWNCIYALIKLSANVYFWHSSTALTNTNTMFYSHFQTLQAHLYFDTGFRNKLDNQAGKVWVSVNKLERNAQL